MCPARASAALRITTWPAFLGYGLVASGVFGGGSLGSLGPLGLASVARERLRALADAGRKQVRVDDV